MKLHARLTTSLGLLALSTGLLVGCAQETPQVDDTAKSDKQTTGQPTAAHDPHDIPLTDEEKEQLRQETATYAAAVQQIQSFLTRSGRRRPKANRPMLTGRWTSSTSRWNACRKSPPRALCRGVSGRP